MRTLVRLPSGLDRLRRDRRPASGSASPPGAASGPGGLRCARDAPRRRRRHRPCRSGRRPSRRRAAARRHARALRGRGQDVGHAVSLACRDARPDRARPGRAPPRPTNPEAPGAAIASTWPTPISRKTVAPGAVRVGSASSRRRSSVEAVGAAIQRDARLVAQRPLPRIDLGARHVRQVRDHDVGAGQRSRRPGSRRSAQARVTRSPDAVELPGSRRRARGPRARRRSRRGSGARAPAPSGSGSPAPRRRRPSRSPPPRPPTVHRRASAAPRSPPWPPRRAAPSRAAGSGRADRSGCGATATP